jgi:hypothetical protein
MESLAFAVYVLCALTAAFCAVLLVRGYLKSRSRLLLWSALCFVGLALNNALLVLDVRTPWVDLSVWRTIPALLGVVSLLYGLIWESRA